MSCSTALAIDCNTKKRKEKINSVISQECTIKALKKARQILMFKITFQKTSIQQCKARKSLLVWS